MTTENVLVVIYGHWQQAWYVYRDGKRIGYHHKKKQAVLAADALLETLPEPRRVIVYTRHQSKKKAALATILPRVPTATLPLPTETTKER